LDACRARLDVGAGRGTTRCAWPCQDRQIRIVGVVADLIGSQVDDASVYCISQKLRIGKIEQMPAAITGLPEGQLNAEAHHVVGGDQALEPGREFAALDWVTEP
jgi:hypothetical protein